MVLVIPLLVMSFALLMERVEANVARTGPRSRSRTPLHHGTGRTWSAAPRSPGRPGSGWSSAYR